ncbi:MauE/DoxX family redox-associated membrane protein [Micromonospora sp. NPDC005979]|uniref:MauE/DoxX family redox-associated membrane protein n=1 Tax=Micromonospora sp. NPDC005979 TaxID=3156726 RepID=UPI0033B6E65F
MSVAVVAAILTLAGALAISIVGKVRNRASFETFAHAVSELRVTSTRRSRPVAAASITAEAGVLALVLWPETATIGLAAAVLLFGAFAVALTHAVRQGSTSGCHCFGPTSATVAWRHVVRTGLLAAAAAGALWGATTLPTVSLGMLPPAQFLVAFTIAAFVTTTLVRLDDLAWLINGVAHTR